MSLLNRVERSGTKQGASGWIAFARLLSWSMRNGR